METIKLNNNGSEEYWRNFHAMFHDRTIDELENLCMDYSNVYANSLKNLIKISIIPHVHSFIFWKHLTLP